MNYGSQSETGKIRSILLKHPKDAFIAQDNIDDQWASLNYTGCPNLTPALTEYENFVALIRKEATDVFFLPPCDRTGLDSLYVHDPVVITNRGAILCNMGKVARKGESEACGHYLEQLGIPILGRITGDGKLEGGDIVWLDPKTLVVGQGYRTNAEGIRQLRELTSGFVDEFIVVPLPHWDGPGDVLHLMSFISPVDRDLAVVYSRLMPVPFREWLINRGIKFVEVPDSEYNSMACNILAIAPRRCIMLSGNPLTKQRLRNEGVEVFEFVGEEISKKGAGGPTCLTRPLLRED